MDQFSKLAPVLLVIGAVNWGLVGAMDLNLITEIFGTGTATQVIYILVGIAGLWGVNMLRCGNCVSSATGKKKK